MGIYVLVPLPIWIKVLIVVHHDHCLYEVEIDDSFHFHHCVIFEELELFVSQVAVYLLHLNGIVRIRFPRYDLYFQVALALW